MPSGKLWRKPDFLRLWAAQTISETGTQVGALAVPLLAIGVLQASAAQLGLLGAARTLPFLLFALPVGALLDRMRRRPVMVASDFTRAALLASIPLAYAFDALTMWHLFVVVALVGALTVFFDVAYQSFLPALVDRPLLTEANAKLTTTRSAAEVVGPGAAGWLVGVAGAANTLVIDSVSYLFSGLLCRRIRHEEPTAPAGGAKRSLRREIGEGLLFVLRHPVLGRIAACAGLTNLASSIGTVLLPLYMIRSLGYSPGLVGLVLAIAGLGLVLGAVIASRLAGRFGLGRTIVGSAIASGLGLVLLPFAGPELSLPFLIGGRVLFGLSVPLFNITQVSLRQAVTPHRLLGRMNASMRFLVWSTISLGSLAAGLLGEVIGLRAALAVAAAIGALSWLTLLSSPVPRLRELPAADGAGG
ncbi:MFS transporter [Actinosynnema sp. NPDC023794]